MKITITIKPEYAFDKQQPKPMAFKSIQVYEDDVLFQYARELTEIVDLCHHFSEKAKEHVFIDRYNKSVEIPLKYITFSAS